MKRKITPVRINMSLLFLFFINALAYAQPCLPPIIANIAPASGPANTVVTINGVGFENGTGTSAILFNGVASTGFTVVSNTEVKAVVPQNSTTGNVSVVTNGCTATTTSFTVIESACSSMPGNAIVTQPVSQDICEGSQAQYSIALNNGSGFTYQWKMLSAGGSWVSISDNANFSGTTTANLTITNTPLAYNSAQFYCVATSGSCSLVSNAAQLTVSPLPIVIYLPVQPTCLISSGSVLIVPLVGSNLTYSINGTNFQSGTTFNNLAPGSYTLTVKTSANCTTSMPFTIDPLPTLPAVANVTVAQPDCNGILTGSITVNSPIDLGLTYSIDGVNFQSSPNFTNLAPGTYTVTVTTSLGCVSVSATITINAVPVTPAAATTTVTQPVCDVTTGAITVTTPTGAGLNYSIDGTTFQTSPTFANLAPGTYTVTVQNTNGGCTSVTTPITINPAPIAPIVAITTVTQPTCNVATGTITIASPIGASLTYSVDGTTFQASPIFANLSAGTYTLTVQNAGGCTSQSSDITINAAPIVPVIATTAVTQPTCDVATGSIIVTTPIGTGLTYSVDGTTFQTSPIFTNLTPGTYTLITQNTTGCTSATTSITINPTPIAPVIATTTVIQPTCNVTTGTITVNTPIDAGVTYSIDGATFQASPIFANLSAGIYTLTVQNAGGCTSQTSEITINAAPIVPEIATTQVSQPDCIQPTGTIVVTAPIGTGFTYSLDDITYHSSATFANLIEGDYTVFVKTAGGCTSQTLPVTINPAPAVPALATTTVTQPTCAVTTGSIVITAPTGAGLTYSIDGTTYQTGTTFANLAEGTYTVSVQNTTGCVSETLPVTINAAPVTPAVATTVVVQPTCITKGNITVTTPTGAGVTYSIDGVTYQSGTLFSDLDPGSYTITVMTAGGCTSQTTSITLNPVPAAPIAAVTTVTQPNCTGITTGSVVIMSPIGTDLTYSIDGTTYQAGTTFTGLASGTYNVTVQNANGCISTDSPITITVPVVPAIADFTTVQPTCTTGGNITITSPTGAGYSYSINGIDFQTGTSFTNLQGGTYTITVMGLGACTSATAAITINNSPAPVVATTTVTQTNCFNNFGSITVTAPVGPDYTYSIDGGLTYQASTAFNLLTPNTYTITVNNGICTSVTAPITIDVAPDAPANFSVNIIQPTCTIFGGTIVIATPPGTTYTYSINGGTYQGGSSFSSLPPGEYNITAMSAGGCISQPLAVTIAPPTGEVLLTSTQGCKEVVFGSTNYILEVTLADTTFNADQVTYTWTTANGTVVGNDSYFNASQYATDNNLTAASYPLEFIGTVTTAGGCQGSLNFNVDGTFCDIPKGISPNNDGMNDSFDISGLNASKLSIFNRYGKEVYSKSSYKNEWFGQTDNNDELPTGTYYYVIDTNGGNKTGWVYINRQDK